MGELKLTKARMELLKAVDAGRVTSVWLFAPASRWVTERWVGPGGPKTVTRPAEALRDAGLVEPWREPGSGYYEPRTWKLTAEGERVLAEHEGRQS